MLKHQIKSKYGCLPDWITLERNICIKALDFIKQNLYTMHTHTKQRIIIREVEPEVWKTVMQIEHQLVNLGLDVKLRELIKVRASQMNACAFCIDLHTQDALKYGENPRRLFALSAWKESPFFRLKRRQCYNSAKRLPIFNKPEFPTIVMKHLHNISPIGK